MLQHRHTCLPALTGAWTAPHSGIAGVIKASDTGGQETCAWRPRLCAFAPAHQLGVPRDALDMQHMRNVRTRASFTDAKDANDADCRAAMTRPKPAKPTRHAG